MKDPHEEFDAQYVFMESTYGNRLHRSFEDSKEELLEAVRYSVSKGEKIIIPAFALERTQEILYLLGEFSREGRLPEIPIYLDSPLAIKATEIFRKNKKYYDEEARAIVEEGFDPFAMPNLRYTPTTEESIAINRQSGSAVIISASGMMNAGRIKHHLKHNLWRPGASLVIVGYQAEGTTGRKIVDGASHVKIFREDVAVRAKVFTIGGFSAHADQKGLLEWVSNFTQSQSKVFLVHGEASACETLAEKIRKDLGLDTYVPRWRERLTLKVPAETIVTAPPDYDAAASEDAVLEELETIEQELDALRATLSSGSRIGTEAKIEKLKKIEGDLRSLFS